MPQEQRKVRTDNNITVLCSAYVSLLFAADVNVVFSAAGFSRHFYVKMTVSTDTSDISKQRPDSWAVFLVFDLSIK